MKPSSEFHPGNTDSDTARALAIERNCWEFFILMARAGGDDIYDGEDVKWVRAGGRAFNRIFAARFSDPPGERVAEVAAEFLSTGSSVLWLTGPSTRPANLGTFIEAAGFSRSAAWAGMDADLNSLPTAKAPPGDCRVSRVLTHSELDVWMSVMCEGFGLKDDSRDATRRRILAIGVDEDSRLRHYIAYQNGVPAAVSTVFLGTESAGVYFVTTLPWARRRGLGASVTRHSVAELAGSELDRVVLQATHEGEKLYQQLGFTRRCNLTVYFLNAGSR